MNRFKNSLIVSSTKVVGGLVTVLLYAIYSYKLDPAKLGSYELALTAINFLSILMSFGFVSYAGGEFTRFTPELVDQHIGKLNTSYLVWVLFLLPWILIPGVYFLPLFNISALDLVLVILIAILQYYKNIYTTTLQHTFRPIRYSIIDALYPIANIFIIFTIFLQFSVLDIDFILLANFLAVFFLFYLYKNDKKIHVTLFKLTDLKSCIPTLKKTYPWFFVALLNWLMYSSDRFVLEYFTSSYQVGLYAQIYKLSSIYNALIVSTISIVYSPYIYKSFLSQNQNYSWGLIKRQAYSVGVITVFILIFVYAFGEQIYQLIVDERYYPAFNYSYLIILQFMLVAISGYFCYIFYFKNVTKYVNTSLLVGFLINLMISCLLTPAYGLYGLLAASIFAQLIIFGYIYKQAKKINFCDVIS